MTQTAPAPAQADAVVTEVIRAGIDSAARQMSHTLVRTAFSPVIYEVRDFAAVLYDRHVRLLAQAESQPIFVGPLGYCVTRAIEGVGGAEVLEPGDVILYNSPYGTGAHPQDAAVIMPMFHDSAGLVGYSAIKAHWLDIGGKDPYSTDTLDVFQEGTVYPPVRIYRRGERVEDIYKIVLANTRLPRMLEGDFNAQVAGVRVGAAALLRLIDRWGFDVFTAATERLFDQGEAAVRRYVEQMPDGRFVGHGEMDSDGVTEGPVPFDVVLEVHGSSVTVDFTNAPDANVGPMNCPVASTIAAARVAITMLAGSGETPNEGHFRPIEVKTRVGSMFHPESPSPCFLYGWPLTQAVETIYRALADVAPERVPAASGGDVCSVTWWGVREATGEPWADMAIHPVGQGAHINGDGANALPHLVASGTRLTSSEIWEAKNPWVVERLELAPDSAGAGAHRGGLGVDIRFRFLEDTEITSTLERTRNAPWGLAGGLPARPNSGAVIAPDGQRRVIGKATRVRIPRGGGLEVLTGGGGGYGDPAERAVEAVHDDLADGYITLAAARRHYPHALGEETDGERSR